MRSIGLCCGHQPQFTKDGELLISDNLNADDVAHLCADVDRYLPRLRSGEP